MTQPTGTSRHVDSALADVSIAYLQSKENALYGNAVPVVPVKHRSDKYHIFDHAMWNKSQARQRAPGDTAAIGWYTLSQETYTCELWSIAHKDPRESQQNADAGLEPRIEATEWCANQLLMKADSLIASAIMGTSIWSVDVVGAGSTTLGTQYIYWSTTATSKPISDVADISMRVQKNCGMKPNVGICGAAVWSTLVNHPDITDRLKYTSKESITTDMVAALFNLDKLIVSGMVHNSAVEGQTASNAYLTDEHDFGLFYFPKSPGRRTLSAAYVFAFDGADGGGDYKQGVRVSEWFDDATNSDFVQNDLYIDVKVTAAGAGAFINEIVQ
jgi:hypothetical protein